MRRRDFITFVGGSAVSWPLAARAQQGERIRRIGVLMQIGADDPEAPALVGAFSQGLAEAGWTIGRNARIDYRWHQGNAEAARAYAAELLALTPDIIFISGIQGTTAVKQLTRTVPIVFVNIADPVGVGIVDSLARPGGNITGFMAFDFSFGGKWLDLLKEIAPHTTRVAVFRDDTNPTGIAQFGVIQAMATSVGLQVTPVSVRNSEIASAVEAFAHSPNGGAIVTGSASNTVHRDLIFKLIARNKLPAIFYDRSSVRGGGLISYGPDVADQFRRAAGYVDRILKGEKPGDLPVQAPTKYELVINLKTAKALGLAIPQPLLASADEVIE